MEDITGTMKEYLYIYSITMVRLTATFISFPLLNKQVIGGAMIRNGIVGAMAIFLFPVVSTQVPDTSPGMMAIFALIMKEVFVGMMIGFMATIPFWALEAAGFFMDNQRGASMASSLNPLSGSESSPMGILFSQTFTTVYLVGGIFLIMLKSVFISYDVWPVFSFYPQFNHNTTLFVLNQFDQIITL